MSKYNKNILPVLVALFFIIAIGILYFNNKTSGFDTAVSADSSDNSVPINTSYVDISGAKFGLPKKLISQDVDMSKMDSNMKDIYYNGISKLFNGFLYS